MVLFAPPFVFAFCSAHDLRLTRAFIIPPFFSSTRTFCTHALTFKHATLGD